MKILTDEQIRKRREYQKKYNQRRRDEHIVLQEHVISFTAHDIVNIIYDNDGDLATALGNRMIDLFNCLYDKNKTAKEIKPKIKPKFASEEAFEQYTLNLIKERVINREKHLVKERLDNRTIKQAQHTQMKLDWESDLKELRVNNIEDESFNDGIDNLSAKELNFELEHMLDI